MYLLPEKLDLDELIGQVVNMVCVGPYDAQVIFEKGMVIQSLHKLEGEVKGVKILWFNGEWKDTSSIMKVPKQEVVAISRASDTELRIELTGNIALCFHTEESQYESINITMPNGDLEVI